MNVLFVQALFAFLVCPGLVAYVIPVLIVDTRGAAPRPIGTGLMIVGTTLLLWCVREFYVAGKGTLAPWRPPRHLVVSGLYRYSRNPMYVAVVILLWGWALAFRSWPLVIYALGVMLAFHLRIVFGEEPWLARTHGEAWTRYRQRVPRWIGRAR
jgi:protein-S-isoprenylcysteine O-methyltransferase Ste14